MTDNTVSFEDVAAYTVAYCEAYRENFDKLVSPSPQGGGLPKVLYPSYCSDDPLDLWVGNDGAVLVDSTGEPPDAWHVAGGPAVCVDFEPTRTPQNVRDILEREGLTGNALGIYRIVNNNLSLNVWEGQLPTPKATITKTTNYGKVITFYEVTLSVSDLLAQFTFGALGPVLSVRLKSNGDDFWDNLRIEGMGFFPADRRTKRFFRLLEVAHNNSAAAWDIRSLWLRIKFDCYRDILSAVYLAEGATIQFSSKNTDIAKLLDKTKQFDRILEELRTVLFQYYDGKESIFQDFLEENPELIDVYGRVTPRPRFVYPDGKSPTGKSYVEPDFVVSYTDGTYRIVEIERPGKRLVTTTGQARSEITQAAFQLSEFSNFIENHAWVLQDKFPRIRASACRYTLIIGRRSVDDLGTFSNFEDLRAHIAQTYRADDVWVYDDLVERGRMAVAAIQGLSRLNP